MTTQYQNQDHIYTQATGTTANEVPAPMYNEKPSPATHQPSYHQDSQPIYTHPQDTNSQIHTQQPGAYQDPSQQYQQAPTPIQPDVYHQQQPVQQVQQPMAGGQAPMPLDRLQRYPDIATCPACARSERTRIEYVSGGVTHLTALAACFIACLGCIPYLVSSLKDCEHYCGNCGALLAVWHRSGHTEVIGGRSGPAPVKKPVAPADAKSSNA